MIDFSLHSFQQHLPAIVLFLKRLEREGATVADALQAYDVYIQELAKSMRPVMARNTDATLASRLAEDERLPGLQCPKCGSPLAARQLCPHVSPVWRTQLACVREGCTWFGRSKLNIRELRAQGLTGAVEG